jgi:hypothetical protein
LSTVWPDHGLQGTKQAKLLGDDEFRKQVETQFDGIVIKGLDPRKEEYSAAGPGMAQFIESKIQNPERIFVTGLATTHCVFATAKELHERYPKAEIYIVNDASKGVYLEKDGFRQTDYESKYHNAGINLINTDDVKKIVGEEITNKQKKEPLSIITSQGISNDILGAGINKTALDDQTQYQYANHDAQAKQIASNIFGVDDVKRPVEAFQYKEEKELIVNRNAVIKNIKKEDSVIEQEEQPLNQSPYLSRCRKHCW